MILGIDFGSSTIKIVLMDGEKLVEKHRIGKEDSFEPILDKMDLSKVTKIMTVGAGASFLEGDIRGIETQCVTEFQALPKGGLFLSGLEECMMVSLGTGTSFTYVSKDRCEHSGGTGMGGALIATLARIGLGMENVGEFLALAEKGALERADLLIKDISKVNIDYLWGDISAANMAKLTKDSRPEDYAFGVCNMVFQNIAVMAVMADAPYKTKKVVVLGSAGSTPIAKIGYSQPEQLFGYEFIVPEDAVYAVAIGAALLAGVDN